MGRGAAEAGPAGRPGHDLKTPLTIISGNAELLDEDNLPPAQQACVQAILRGARSAEDYVTHLQAITTGLPPAASAQTVSCADLAQACAALGRDLTAPKGITFSWQTDPHPLPDRALSLDRTAFLRAAENLLSNGVRYTPAGQTLDCGLRLTAQRLFLWVQDSGPASPPRHWPRPASSSTPRSPAAPRAGIWGWASIPPPRPPGPTAADYAWKTPPVGAGPPCGFLFHNISAIFPKAVAFLEKPFVLWSGRSPTQIPMRRRLTMP